MKDSLNTIKVTVLTKDIIDVLWDKIAKKYPGIQFDEDEDEVFYLVDIGNTYDCPHSNWIKHKITGNEGKIIKHIWCLKQLI